MRVECIDASDCPFWGKLTLVKGKIYTVVEVGQGHSAKDYVCGKTYLLAEDRSPSPDGHYMAARFRPITDITVFNEMLKTTEKEKKHVLYRSKVEEWRRDEVLDDWQRACPNYTGKAWHHHGPECSLSLAKRPVLYLHV